MGYLRDILKLKLKNTTLTLSCTTQYTDTVMHYTIPVFRRSVSWNASAFLKKGRHLHNPIPHSKIFLPTADSSLVGLCCTSYS